MEMLYAVIIAVGAYLIGSINTSILLSKAVSGEDIRNSGSGNAGATNMLRTHGKKMGVITLICDVLKGIIAVLLAGLIAPKMGDLAVTAQYIAGIFVVLGHNFPVFFGFKGGKGVATSLGVMMLLNWQLGLIVLAVALLTIILTRYVSLGSIVGAAAYIIGELILLIGFDGSIYALIFSVIVGGLLIIRHKANISRLINGTENKLGSDKGKQNK